MPTWSRGWPALVAACGWAISGRLRFEAGFATVGCTIQARADLDPAGVTIADQVLPVASSGGLGVSTRERVPGVQLSDHHDAPVDLATAVVGLQDVHDLTRVVVHEERVLALLMADLAAIARSVDQ
ncbi:DUF2399 domain-containing protein [Lentzea atacamensis]|uniref:DUF2399 domain-containing protein n=1 Tax=Lentzea atacamensis TaxID=531938 RepID=UPI00389955BF